MRPGPRSGRAVSRAREGRGRRAFVVVLDACGAGALPDADEYGDAGANTLGHLAAAVGGLDLPHLGALGLGDVLPLAGVPPAPAPALHGRLRPLGPGKDSATGHWELMGVVPPAPLPTYPRASRPGSSPRSSAPPAAASSATAPTTASTRSPTSAPSTSARGS